MPPLVNKSSSVQFISCIWTDRRTKSREDAEHSFQWNFKKTIFDQTTNNRKYNIDVLFLFRMKSKSKFAETLNWWNIEEKG